MPNMNLSYKLLSNGSKTCFTAHFAEQAGSPLVVPDDNSSCCFWIGAADLP